MSPRDVVVIGGSAGALEALLTITEHLPADLPASVMIAVHYPEDGTSRLPEILARGCRLRVTHALDGEQMQRQHVYVAPPGRHLVIEKDLLRLSAGPTEHAQRPAIDLLFRSAAFSYGRRVVAIVLSGALDDGSAGLVDVWKVGGLTVVQRPGEALYPSMPRTAMELVDVDYVLPASEIGSLIAREAINPTATRSHELAPPAPEGPSTFSCPDCGGILFEQRDGKMVTYRCRVGHRYGSLSLMSSQSRALEAALWESLRALEERVELSLRLAERSRKSQRNRAARRYEHLATVDRRRAELVRDALHSGQDQNMNVIDSDEPEDSRS